MRFSPISPRSKWVIAFIIFSIYPVSTTWMMSHYGVAAGGTSGVIVAGMIGTWFGFQSGLGGAFLLILLNLALANLVTGAGLLGTLTEGGFLLGSSILLFTGALAGLSRDNLEKQLEQKAGLQSRERFLLLLNKMTHSIITAENLDEMMDTLINDLKTLLGADDCYITQWSEDLQKTLPLRTSNSSAASYHQMDIPTEQNSMTRSVIREGRILVTEDVFNSPYISPEIAQQFPARSLIGIPLIHGQMKLGAILIAYNTPHKFIEEELNRAEQAGNQVAIAFWNSRQEFELQKRLKETDALNHISQALSQGERIGLSKLLDLIADSARELILGAEEAVIHLLDESETFLTAEAVAGFKDAIGNRVKMRLGEGVAGQVIADGETINILDVSVDDRFIKMDTPARFRSLMVAPIISGTRRFGTISVQSKLPNAFTNNDQDMLTTLGTQAAIAIENARLLEDTQQALLETNALYRISQGLVSLNTVELLKDVVDLLQRNFGYYHVQVFIRDQETGDFVLEAGSGEVGRQLKAEGFRLHPGTGIVGYAAETSVPFFTNNVDEVVFFNRNPHLPETKSELAVPVSSGNTSLGVLDIQQAPPNIFTARDLQLVSAVAGQLAVALQKADLYQNLQISLEHEKMFRDQLVQSERLALMGKLLASVSHELNNPLQAIQNALFLLKGENSISSQGRQDLEIVLSETERMAAMIERLRATYRPIQAEDFRPMQINTIIEDVYALVSTHFRHRNISFEFFPDPILPEIPGLPDQIRQVVLNLFMNAADAANGEGTLSVSTKHLKSSNEVFLSVADDGMGIDPSILPNVFDAFITNKEKGTGLGLTICYDIIVKHHGRIAAENNPDRGATFRIWLPTRRLETE